LLLVLILRAVDVELALATSTSAKTLQTATKSTKVVKWSSDLRDPDFLLKRQVRGWSHPRTVCAGFEQDRPPDYLGRLAGTNIEEK